MARRASRRDRQRWAANLAAAYAERERRIATDPEFAAKVRETEAKDARARELGYRDWPDQYWQERRAAERQWAVDHGLSDRPGCRKCGGSGVYNYGWMNPWSDSNTSMGDCPACGGRG